MAFESDAPNLVPADTNGRRDIFVRDRLLASTERINLDGNAAQAAGGHSYVPAISADGRFVAFESAATNLVPGNTNGYFQIFVRDRLLAITERVSVDGNAAQAAGGDSYRKAISADGRFVAFESYATNLAPGDTNANPDIFVRDRLLGTTERVSVDGNGAQAVGGGSFGPAITADGRLVAFDSDATNLVPGDANDNADVFLSERGPGAQHAPPGRTRARRCR